MNFFARFRRNDPVPQQPVVVVSGLPRSGTSMMMKMLEAGGIAPLTDERRAADVDNPKGYYEFERVKALDKGDYTWLADAQGRAVKIISALLKHLPPDYEYQILFMRRDLNEILASQKKMLVHRGEDTGSVGDEELAGLYQKHLSHVYAWVASQPNVSLLDVNYNTLLRNPAEEIAAVNRFLGGKLDAAQMAGVVDGKLYRNRATSELARAGSPQMVLPRERMR